MHKMLCFDQKKIPPLVPEIVSHRSYAGSTTKKIFRRKNTSSDSQI